MTLSRFLVFLLLMIWNLGFSQIRITFKVHISDLPIGLGGVHVAGQFLTNESLSIKSDWLLSAPGSQLQLLSDSTYTVSVDFPKSSAGKTLLFQFSRDSTWSNQNGDISEGNPNECCLNTTCAMPGGNGGFDRILTIPKCGGEYICEWNKCGSLVVFSPPFLRLSPESKAICKGDTIQLGATSDGIVSWDPDPGFSCIQCLDPFVTPMVRTVYKATSTKNNCITRDSILIRPEVPFLQLPSDELICLGKTIPISASGNGTLIWSPPDGLSCTQCLTPAASPIHKTQYKATMHLGSCTLVDSVVIDVDTHFVRAGQDQTILYGNEARLEAFGPGGFQWSPVTDLSCVDCPSPLAKPEVKTTYTVQSTSPNGCKVSDSTTIFVNSVCDGVFFPNLLTINEDSKNDQFTLASITNRANCRLIFDRFEVYNRWGIKEFETTDPNFTWPGNEKPIGIYFYTITFTEKKWNGWMQLFH